MSALATLTPLTEEPVLVRARKALDKAKIELMTRPDSVFFSEIAFSFVYEFTYDVPTAATDGVKVYINPEFFMEWNREQHLGLMLHETLHPVFMHLIRRGIRDPKIWNYAGDYVINLVIKDRGFQLPDGGLYDTQYRDMTTEQVYDKLIAQAKRNPSAPQPGDGKSIPGTGLDIMEPAGTSPGEALDAEAAKALQERMEDILIRASIRSREANDKPGTIPGELEIFINGLLKPKLPWHQILRNYLAKYTKAEFTFKKPNRRFFPDYFLPSMYSTSLIDIAVAIDTSGSVTDHEFHTGISEVAAIFKMAKPEKITFIQFDTAIKSVEKIHNFFDLMKVKFSGRGGTEIGELVNWVKEKKPQLTLVFTDGHFNFRNYDLKSDVIWLIHNNPKFNPKFGKAIHYVVRK